MAESKCKHALILYEMKEDFLDGEIIWLAKCKNCGALGDWEESKEMAVAALRKETPNGN